MAVHQRLSWLGRKPALYATLGAALAVIAGGAWTSAAGAASAAVPVASAAVQVSASPLGISLAPWDGIYSTTGSTTYTGSKIAAAAESMLKAAGVNQIHYGGGTTADDYNWQTDRETGKTYNDGLDFAKVSAAARGLGAQTFATVNYGSGTPALAAAWVKQSQKAGQGVSYWEIGNENYGCWETDQFLKTCPGWSTQADVQTLATSYATHAADFMAAMKAQDPNAKLGVPWAFDATVPGAFVGFNNVWNDTVLGTDAADISFVDAHWYPFGKTVPSDQKVIQSVIQIPAEYATIQAELNANVPGAKVIVGETGVSYLETSIPCKPAGALFAAGDALEWLAAGAQGVDWWPMDTNTNANYTGTNCKADEAMFSNPANPAKANPQPLTPYVGYLMASALAKPGSQLSTLTQQGDVLGFQSVSSGHVAVAFINTSTSAAETVNIPAALTGPLSKQSYSAGNQNSSNTRIVTSATTASAIAGGLKLPAESITVLQTIKPSAITVGTSSSSNTFKAGTKLAIKGKLTLNNVAAPAGVSVKITRKVTSGKGTNATLTAKTVSGGGFSVTDLPPATGKYTYIASYSSNSYAPASRAVVVTVTAAKPSLKLAVSAKSVRPGTKVTVTATLGAPHVNKTLVIYAQVKGGAKKVIKRGTVNSKGHLSVVLAVKANTTFTVTFSGDTWYTSGSATAAVKA
ncbi:hypothetical protein EAS64_31245 [Trebonia kvetii]|uniref:Uncharacterized protein n=1 Tax=Trebonia kvetii TaxID=2480626 RepID=A0A6P2BUL5_9ACTN|nr:hypothetical protein [Trebonia kvetii]TVZ01916.1 hypothetical protein EAS64_31245 [Trebonia kvetii]